MTTIVFDKVTRATPAGADMIVSYQYATWTSGAFSLIGIYFFISLFSIFCLVLYKILYDLALVFGVLSFRGAGVVGHRESKTSPVEEGTSESVSNSQPNEEMKIAKEDVTV